MKVLFVTNNAYTRGNGLSTSVRNTIRNLREHGVDVRLMAAVNPDPAGPQPDFPLKIWKIPLFDGIIRANGFCYAKIERKVIREAVAWADVVHFEECFMLERVVRRIAVKQGKALTATYHLLAENITANLGFPKKNLISRFITWMWVKGAFNYCSDVQCPTAEVARHFKTFCTRPRVHVISNGIRLYDEFVPEPRQPEPTVDILCIGRLAREKSQETLLNAMRYCRHAGRIRLFFAGNGPKAKLYHKKADSLYRDGVLSYAPSFGFYTPEQLRDLARQCYLYVHCAWVEVEGLSCLEATREGLVPVIGEGELIGTSQFALCPESLYPACDSRALADRIDWWIEHPAKRNEMAVKYAEAARNYALEDSIEALVTMFRQAIEER